MEIIIQPTKEDVSSVAARMLAALIKTKPNAVLGLPTGGTPLGLYKELIRKHKEEGLDFTRVVTFNTDEFVGLDPDHPCSFNSFMYKNFFNFVNIRPHNINIPDGMVRDIPKHCAEYERRILEAGGIDTQVLGIGMDGHVCFNEPTSSLASRTRIKTLTNRTKDYYSRFFTSSDEVPRHCITMGIGTIMEARQCLLIAVGAEKANAVAQMIEGPITAMVPASILQMHPDCKVVIDEAAASRLQYTQYYKYVYDEKPDWQHV